MYPDGTMNTNPSTTDSYLQVNPGLTQVPCKTERTQAYGCFSRGEALAPMLTRHLAATVRAAFLWNTKRKREFITNSFSSLFVGKETMQNMT
jgi:hypothetical protein